MAVQKFFGKAARLFEDAVFVITGVRMICSENTENILCIFGEADKTISNTSDKSTTIYTMDANTC